MTTEKLAPRVLRKIEQAVRWLTVPGVVRVALRGGNVRTYVHLRAAWLQRLGIRTVVDVGANVGQFAELACRAFPEATVYCFEPIPECFAKLQTRLAGVPSVFLHNVALADEPGMFTLVRNPYSPSSSLLEMEPLHVKEFPWTAGGKPLAVPVSTLDAVLAGRTLATPLLIKIDVQGAEDRVIAGGRGTLGRASVAIVETSFEALYKGQPLFNDVNALMHREGFRYTGEFGQLTSPKDGRILQADAVFVRA